MSEQEIIEVGKALLPYLRNDLSAAELGTAAHDAVAALNRTRSGTVTIPRAQYEALMGAAEAIYAIYRTGENDPSVRTWPDVDEEVAALRSAGIEETR